MKHLDIIVTYREIQYDFSQLILKLALERELKTVF